MKNTKLMVRLEAENDKEPVRDTDVMSADVVAKTDAEAVDEASGNIEELGIGIDNAMEAAGEVSAVSEIMSEAVTDGEGLTPREASMVEARLERAAALVGGDLSAMGLTFRREAFGGFRESRLGLTKMRLEAAEGFGKRILESLKKAWQWLKDAIAALFGKLTKSAESLENRFKTLEARLKQVTGKPKEAKLSIHAKTFSVEGKTSVDTIRSFAGDVDKLMKVLSELEHNGADSVMLSASLNEIVRKRFKSQEVITASGDFKDAEAYGRFPNGYSMVFRTKTKSIDSKAFRGDNEVSISTISVEQIDAKFATEYDAPDQKDMREIIAAGLSVSNAVESLGKHYMAVEIIIDGQIKYIEKKKMTELTNHGDQEILRESLRAYHEQTKVLFHKVPTSFFTVGSAMADVVAAGISNIG